MNPLSRIHTRIHAMSVTLLGGGLLLSGLLPVLAQPDTTLPTDLTDGAISVTADRLLLDVTFDAPDDWERYSNPAGTEIGVENGVYRMFTMLGGYIWGLHEAPHSDVIIEAEMMQLSIFDDNAFGVMCRADPANNGDGYYFIINANGYYTVRIGAGDRVLPLVDWAESDAIATGINLNRMRAVCVGDYLALYVNDVLLAETTDDTFSEGYPGLAIAAVQNTGADTQFDNVRVYAASVAE